MCDVHYLRSLCVHLHLSDLFPPAPLGLDGDFGEGSVRQLVSPRVGCVCVCVCHSLSVQDPREAESTL